MTKWPWFPLSDDLKRYYALQMAHHSYSMLHHLFIAERKFDFHEMNLHHIATIAAMTFSYFTNHFPTGATVLFIHDIGDVFFNLSKYGRDAMIITISWVKYVMYFLLLFSWFYPRVVMNLQCIIPATLYTRHFTDYRTGDLALEDLR